MTLPVADIQGNILRGYRKRKARHFALGVGDAVGAKRFLSVLVSGDTTACPQVTTAVPWKKRPKATLNVGLTFAGLQALGLPSGILDQFPDSFRDGPQASAIGLGDTKKASPEHWIMGGPGNPETHILVSLYTDEDPAGQLEGLSKQLRKLFKKQGLTENSCHDADALPDSRVHFGYRDGIAQPRIEGVPGRPLPEDMQPRALPGDFLLGCGYRNQFGGNFRGDLPNAIADNGTYSAFRILRQHVRTFEKFIGKVGERWNLDPELVAAKLMGRWRNGNPLTLSPEAPEPKLPYDQLNAFDYRPSESAPAFYDDRVGLRCPIGAHIRRLNPRGSVVMGKPHSRRIIRRGMPYGPAYDPNARKSPEQGVERGLIGQFICGDLAMQFEFLQKVWVNQDMSTSGLRGTREPILGDRKRNAGAFVIRTDDTRDPIKFDNLPRLVTTRGSVYTFIPGIGGLRYLASI